MRVPINLTFPNRPFKDINQLFFILLHIYGRKKEQSHNFNLVNVLNTHDEFCELVVFGQKIKPNINGKALVVCARLIQALNLKTNCLLTLSTLQATSHRPLLNVDCKSAGIYVKNI